jgi:hypothetical protein
MTNVGEFLEQLFYKMARCTVPILVMQQSV